MPVLERIRYFSHDWILIMFKDKGEPGVVAHVFNPGTWEAEAGIFLSLRPAWSTE
jgi:major histocompatibility complex class I